MSRSTRDDFPPRVVNALRNRAAFICSNPDCRSMTLSPSAKHPEKFIFTGVAAHISAASERGPRYDPMLTSEERSSIENGIFLCASCATAIDKNNGIDFPVDLLKTWKKLHEDWVSRNLNKSIHTDVSKLEVYRNEIKDGSIIVNLGQLGGQVAHSITNIGPQSRHISEASGKLLVERLSQYPPERFSILSANDPESQQLSSILEQLLASTDWLIVNNKISLTATMSPGITIHVRKEDSEKPSLLELLKWFKDVGFQYQGNAYDSGLDHTRIDIGPNNVAT